MKQDTTKWSNISICYFWYFSNFIKFKLAARPGGDRRADAWASEWKWSCPLTSLFRLFVNFYDVI